MRRADFDQQTAVHHGDLVGDRQGFGLIVGDEDRRDVGAPLQRFDFRTHLHAQLGVEVAQRLVQQHDLRLVDERAGEGDPLLLAAGEFWRWAVFQAVETDDLEHVTNPFLDLILRFALDGQWIGDVFGNRHMRPNRVGLKDHADGPLVGRHIDALAGGIDGLTADGDLTAVGPLQTRHAAQRRGLAATAGAQERVK